MADTTENNYGGGTSVAAAIQTFTQSGIQQNMTSFGPVPVPNTESTFASASQQVPYQSSFNRPNFQTNNIGGSISLGSISLSKDGGGGWTQTGGLNFDLPLSAIAAFQNNAMSFTAANSDINKGFLANILNNQQSAISNVARISSGLSQSAIDTSRAISAQNADVAKQIATQSLEASKYAQSQQTARTQAETTAAANSGGCYFTTAICEHWKMADDCDMLETMRKFRDEILLKNPETEALVQEYYERAPAIVEKINAMENADEVWEYVGQAYLKPGVMFCKMGQNKMALHCYKQLCGYLDRITTE